jgi:tryptophan-rich sensory protein
MFGPPVLAGCYNKPGVTVVLRSSTPCTLVCLTELRPTFTNFRRLVVLTWTIVIFRFLTSAFSVFARQSPYGRRDLADLTATRPYQARYVMFGPPVLADYYTRPRGAVVLRSSTPCTLTCLTELRPTFTNFRRLLVLTWTIVIFRFLTSAFSVFARQSPNGRRDLADLTAIRLCQARYVMFGPRCWRTATPGQGVPLYFGPVHLVLRPSYLNFGLLSQIFAVYSF